MIKIPISTGTCGYTCIDAPVEVPCGAPVSSDPLQWNSFVFKIMAKAHAIDIEMEDDLENQTKSFNSSKLQK